MLVRLGAERAVAERLGIGRPGNAHADGDDGKVQQPFRRGGEKTLRIEPEAGAGQRDAGHIEFTVERDRGSQRFFGTSDDVRVGDEQPAADQKTGAAARFAAEVDFDHADGAPHLRAACQKRCALVIQCLADLHLGKIAQAGGSTLGERGGALLVGLEIAPAAFGHADSDGAAFFGA